MSEEKKTTTAVTIIGTVIHSDMTNEKYPKITVEDKSGQYPTLLTLDINPEKISRIPEVGAKVEASGYVSSREWNGRYFTGVRCSFCKTLDQAKPAPSSPAPESASDENKFEDDVPF